MVAIDAYKPGTPNWVDVSGPDMDESVAFYTSLFGWTCDDAGPPEETGGYRMFRLRGRDVAGIGPHQDNAGPPAWSTYIASGDADAAAAKITAAGGTLLMEPMDVVTAGRMFFATDPTGAAFAVWEGRDHAGAGIVNEAGSFSWNELNTRDPETAFAFYEAVFGWEAVTDTSDGTTYTEFRLDGRSIAGGLDMRGRVPDEIPAHWLTYFSVDDTDRTLATVQRLGGSVLVPATDIAPGRFGVVADPAGAFFAVITITESL